MFEWFFYTTQKDETCNYLQFRLLLGDKTILLHDHVKLKQDIYFFSKRLKINNDIKQNQ